MTYSPHSLLDSVKLAAGVAGMEWALAHRYYRDLQGGNRSEVETSWLPKSLGRNIWHASPNFLARFLIAVAMTDDPASACTTVTFVSQFTPDGRSRYRVENIENHVEHLVAGMLGDPDKADAVDRVEFDPMKLEVEAFYHDGSRKLFATPGSADETTIYGAIYRRGVIPGSVFSGMSRTINWRVDSPLKVPEGEVDPEA